MRTSNILYICILAALLLSACVQKSDMPAYGYMRMDLNLNADMVEVKSQVGTYAPVPSLEDFTLTLENSTGRVYWTGPVNEWTESIKMPVGTYCVKAQYGEGEGYESPTFAAEQMVDILVSDTLDVSLEARLSNCMVNLETTSMFDNYFKDYKVCLRTGSGNVFYFPKDTPARPVFIEAFRFSIEVWVETFTGKSYEFTTNYENGLQPATFYTLKLDANEVGASSIEIRFNDKLEVVRIEEDLNE